MDTSQREKHSVGHKPVPLNVCIIGAEGCGKSTLLAQVLVQTKSVDKGVVAAAEGDAMQVRKGDRKLSWIVDRSREERQSGGSICSHDQWRVHLSNYRALIVDTPGKSRYLKNAITAMQNCDAAILHISAVIGEYENGIGADGSIRDTVLVAFALGVRFLIIAIGKMDDATVAFSKDRYQQVKNSILDYTAKVGYSPGCTAVLPLSGFTGSNVAGCVPSARMPWYKGSTLLQLLDSLPAPHRMVTRPLRVPIQRVYNVQGVGDIAVGRIEAGSVSVQDPLFVPACVWLTGKTRARLSSNGNSRPLSASCSEGDSKPRQPTIKVRSLEIQHATSARAETGELVGIASQSPSLPDGTLRPGMVIGLCDEHAPRLCREFEAQVLILRVPGKRPLRVGSAPVVDIHSAHVACRVSSIILTFDRHTSVILDRNPAYLFPGTSAIVRFTPLAPVTVEPFHKFPALGRFCLREGSTLLGVGVVRDVATVSSSQLFRRGCKKTSS
ncbi:Elongation factor 1-alpha [Diplonema papillatum]|nr:Elongation factor 1-alpha [Diplonema papillatum]